jgi:hypothetical protein
MGGIQTLLGQAAPVDDQAARDENIKRLLAMAQANQAADPSLMPATGPAPAPQTMPAQGPAAPAAPAPEGNIITRFLMSLLPSTKSLAPQGQPTPPPPTAEQLAQRNRAISGQ